MTFAKARDRAGLLAVLMLVSAAVIGLSVHFSMTPLALSPAAEAAIVGASACGFWGGVAVGLGLASLFGCWFCGVPSVLIGAVVFFACVA